MNVEEAREYMMEKQREHERRLTKKERIMYVCEAMQTLTEPSVREATGCNKDTVNQTVQVLRDLDVITLVEQSRGASPALYKWTA